MERRTFIAISAAASMALAASCASFSEGTDSGSGSDGGPDAGPSADAADSAAVPDGAAADASDAAPPPSQCTGTPVEEPFVQTFTQSNWSLSGAPVLDTKTGLPPPSLFAEVPLLATSEAKDNSIRKDFPLGGNRRVCIELDVLLEQVSGDFTVDGYAEVLEVGSDTRGLYAEMRAQGFSFTDNSTPKKIDGFQFLKWQHLVVKLQYDLVTAPSLELAGVSVITGEGPMGNTAPDHITVHLGLESKGQGGNAGAMRVNIDNFRFTSEP